MEKAARAKGLEGEMANNFRWWEAKQTSSLDTMGKSRKWKENYYTLPKRGDWWACVTGKGLLGPGVEGKYPGGTSNTVQWFPQDLRVVNYWAGKRLINRRAGVTSRGQKRTVRWEAKGFRGSPEGITFSKVQESIKPQKHPCITWGRRKPATGLHDGEGSMAREGKKNLFIVFMGKWDVIEGMEWVFSLAWG